MNPIEAIEFKLNVVAITDQLLPLLKNGSLNCLTFVKQIRLVG